MTMANGNMETNHLYMGFIISPLLRSKFFNKPGQQHKDNRSNQSEKIHTLPTNRDHVGRIIDIILKVGGWVAFILKTRFKVFTHNVWVTIQGIKMDSYQMLFFSFHSSEIFGNVVRLYKLFKRETALEGIPKKSPRAHGVFFGW